MGTRSARRPGALVWLAVLIFFALSTRASDAQTIPLQAAFAGESYALFEDGATTVVTATASQRTYMLPRTEGVVYSALAATQAGWLVAGSERDEDGLRALFLVEANDDGDGVRILRGPGRQKSFFRQGAVILLDGHRLAGLAWLEGDGRRQLAVMASEWTGKRWRVPRTVSRPGPGSQLALAGTVLADGSWLLTWSAFDGKDDEILWSRRIGKRWSRPQPVSAGNEVPDVAPTLAPCGTGALAAWSRYSEGHYRLQLARFDGHGWVEERTAGGPGTLFPVFLPNPETEARLLFRDASTQGWSALELDSAGLEVRRVDIVGSSSQRPLVTTTASDQVRFAWAKDEDALEVQWHPVTEGQP